MDAIYKDRDEHAIYVCRQRAPIRAWLQLMAMRTLELMAGDDLPA